MVTLICLVIIVAMLLLIQSRKQPSNEPPPIKDIPESSPTPAPGPPLVATTPTPEPTPEMTPAPPPVVAETPKPLDLTTVAHTPAFWPKQIALTKPVPMSISFNGKVVGQAQVPAGTVLKLVRVNGSFVEVEYQGGRQFVPAASTDLLRRAIALQSNSIASGEPATESAAPPAVETPTPFASFAPTTAAATAAPALPNSDIAQELQVEVIRQKRSRVEGGDYDDKIDHIALKIRFANADPRHAIDHLRGEIYIFAQSILNRNTLKLAGTQQFDVNLPPRGNQDLTTDEVSTGYDTTGARWGFKYEGWLLILRDATGKNVLQKATIPSLLKNAEHMSSLAVDHEYDRTTLKPEAFAMNALKRSACLGRNFLPVKNHPSVDRPEAAQ